MSLRYHWKACLLYFILIPNIIAIYIPVTKYKPVKNGLLFLGHPVVTVQTGIVTYSDPANSSHVSHYSQGDPASSAHGSHYSQGDPANSLRLIQQGRRSPVAVQRTYVRSTCCIFKYSVLAWLEPAIFFCVNFVG